MTSCQDEPQGKPQALCDGHYSPSSIEGGPTAGCFLVAERLEFYNIQVNGVWPWLMIPVTLPTSRTLVSVLFFVLFRKKEGRVIP